jgi:hypothetical protein
MKIKANISVEKHFRPEHFDILNYFAENDAKTVNEQNIRELMIDWLKDELPETHLYDIEVALGILKVMDSLNITEIVIE